MATLLSFVAIAVVAIVAVSLATFFVRIGISICARTTAPGAFLGSRIGGLAMLLPSVWFAFFLGSPLGGGMLIGAMGESAMLLGEGFGFGASIFCGILLGSVAGALIGSFLDWVCHARAAT